jgi:hypothetical protein
MPVEVKVETTGPLGQIDRMLRLIKEFPDKMTEEMTNWQIEDLNRKPENVQTGQVQTSSNETAVATIITQHTEKGQERQISIIPKMRRRRGKK